MPTTNFILKWSKEVTNSHKYDENLSEVALITKDAFEPLMPLSGIVLMKRTAADPPEPQLVAKRLKAARAKAKGRAFSKRSMLFLQLLRGPIW